MPGNGNRESSRSGSTDMQRRVNGQATFLYASAQAGEEVNHPLATVRRSTSFRCWTEVQTARPSPISRHRGLQFRLAKAYLFRAALFFSKIKTLEGRPFEVSLTVWQRSV